MVVEFGLDPGVGDPVNGRFEFRQVLLELGDVRLLLVGVLLRVPGLRLGNLELVRLLSKQCFVVCPQLLQSLVFGQAILLLFASLPTLVDLVFKDAIELLLSSLGLAILPLDLLTENLAALVVGLGQIIDGLLAKIVAQERVDVPFFDKVPQSVIVRKISRKMQETLPVRSQGFVIRVGLDQDFNAFETGFLA